MHIYLYISKDWTESKYVVKDLKENFNIIKRYKVSEEQIQKFKGSFTNDVINFSARF